MKRMIGSFTAIAVLALTLFGCIGVNRSFRETRNYLLESIGGKFDKQIEFSVGPVGIVLAKAYVGFSDNGIDTTEMLNKIHRVQLSVFERSEPEQADLGVMKAITERMENCGLELIVRTKDGNEMTAVFLKSSHNEINKIFIMALSNKELVLIELLGDIDELLELAVNKKGLAMLR